VAVKQLLRLDTSNAHRYLIDERQKYRALLKRQAARGGEREHGRCGIPDR
jgi:hypothetical protein